MENNLNLREDAELLLYVGKRLKALRKNLGFSQEELAYKAGFSRSYYSDVETGKRNISILNLYKLSVSLDVPLSEMLDFTELFNGLCPEMYQRNLI